MSPLAYEYRNIAGAMKRRGRSDWPSAAGTSYSMGNLTSDVPVVKWASVYQTGDTLSSINQRLPAGGCHLELPNGFEGEIVDFTQSNYGAYISRARSLFCVDGPSQAKIKMRPYSSTKGSLVPAQSTNGNNPLTALRISPSNGTTQYATTFYGLTFDGGEQGHTYNGLVMYWPGQGSSVRNVRFMGFSEGDWNSPPGETNMYQTYQGANSDTEVITLLEGIEASGYRLDGGRAGSAFSTTGCGKITYRDVNVHDMEVSGVTFGTAGNISTGSLTRNAETYRLKSWGNANISKSGGQTFGGINHEGINQITHVQPDIFISNQSVVQKEHVAVNNAQGDAPVRIIDPEWHGTEGGSAPWAYGLFSVGVDVNYPNQKQTHGSIYVEKNGVQLQPITRAQASSGDPTKHYVALTASV